MVTQLETLLQCTGHGTDLAKDMLTPLMYDVDVRIILDNSGSMSLDMFGMSQWGGGNIDARTQYDPMRLQQVLTQTVLIAVHLTQGRGRGEAGQASEGSFSAVSKPNCNPSLI